MKHQKATLKILKYLDGTSSYILRLGLDERTLLRAHVHVNWGEERNWTKSAHQSCVNLQVCPGVS